MYTKCSTHVLHVCTLYIHLLHTGSFRAKTVSLFCVRCEEGGRGGGGGGRERENCLIGGGWDVWTGVV